MKNVLQTLVLLFVGWNCYAQTPVLPTENAEWIEGRIDFMGACGVSNFKMYAVQEEEVFFGNTFHNVYWAEGSVDVDWEEATYAFSYRVDGDYLWGVDDKRDQEYLLFDASIEVGDSLELAYLQSNNEFGLYPLKLIAIDTVLVEGGERRRWAFVSADYLMGRIEADCPFYWIEGIGGVMGLLNYPQASCDSQTSYETILLCMKEEEEVKYQFLSDCYGIANNPFGWSLLATEFVVCEGQKVEVPMTVGGGICPYLVEITDPLGDIELFEIPDYIYYPEQTISFPPSVSGSYKISIKDGAGTKYDGTFQVDVGTDVWEPIEIVKRSFDEQCTELDSMILSTKAEYATYQWKWDGLLVSSEPTLKVYELLDYTLEVSNEYGCTEIKEFELNTWFDQSLNARPIPMLQTEDWYQESLCDGDTIIFNTAQTYESYRWEVPDGQMATTDTFLFVYKNRESDNVTVWVTDEQGCEGKGVWSYRDPIIISPRIHAFSDGLMASGSPNIQWYLNGEPIEGANDRFYKPLEDGDYSISVGNSRCPIFSDSFYFDYTSILPVSTASISAINCYPNPSSQQVYVKVLMDVPDKSYLSIMNILGQVVWKQSYESLQKDQVVFIPLSDMAKGLYMLQLYTVDQQVLGNDKILLE